MNASGYDTCSFGSAYCTPATGVPGEGQLLRRKMRCKAGSPTLPSLLPDGGERGVALTIGIAV